MFLTTRTYYDKEYSVIQVNKQNHLSGADITSNAYDFANRVTKTRRDHTATPPGGSAKTYYIREEYTYDDAGRLRFTRHHIKTTAGVPTGGWIVTAAPLYDELNRLADKRLHASNYDGTSQITLSSSFNYLQSVDYSYNIRGWLTGINDPASCATQGGDQLADLFNMGLDYESTANGATAQYNGNIAAMQWRTNVNGSCLTRQQYRFSYDYANRMLSANHYTHNGTAWVNTNNYSESSISYDLNGNLKTYTRRGQMPDLSFNVIDNLTYTYGDAARPDRLTNMSDAGNATKGFKFKAGAAAYQYDLNGNLTLDNHKELSFQYNYLNLPNYITNTGGADITLTYTADGEKLTKVSSAGTRNYVSGIEYLGANLDAIFTAEGRCTPNGATAFYYEYTLKDHLGNARVNFRANGTAITFLQELHYYPFGMLMDGIGTAKVTDNSRKYNGKELNEDLGLNLYDYGARWYDPAVGRWWTVDPMGEKSLDISSYVFVANNPLIYLDPTGMFIELSSGLTGLAREEREKAQQEIAEKQDMPSDYIFLNSKGQEIGRIADKNVRQITFIPDENFAAFDALPYGRQSIDEAQSLGVTYDVNSIEQLEKKSKENGPKSDPNVKLANGKPYQGNVEFAAPLSERRNGNGTTLFLEWSKMVKGQNRSSEAFKTLNQNDAHYHPGPFVKNVLLNGLPATVGGNWTLPPSSQDYSNRRAARFPENMGNNGLCMACKRYDVVLSPTHIFFYQENQQNTISLSRNSLTQ